MAKYTSYSYNLQFFMKKFEEVFIQNELLSKRELGCNNNSEYLILEVMLSAVVLRCNRAAEGP